MVVAQERYVNTVIMKANTAAVNLHELTTALLLQFYASSCYNKLFVTTAINIIQPHDVSQLAFGMLYYLYVTGF